MIFASLADSACASLSLATGSRGRHGLVAARHEDPAFGTLELDAVRELAAHDHVHAVRIEGLGLERTVDVPQALLRELGLAPDLDRPRVLGVHRPVRGVEVVRAPARDHAGTELLAAQPARAVVALLGVDALLGVVDVRRRAEPRLVIQVLRHRHLRLVVARRVAGQADVHRLQLADAAVADELGRVAELRRRTLLAADLEDAAAALDGVAERAALGDRERGGLLQVDVLAGLDGRDRRQRVPVVGRADHDGVHVLAREQVAVVAVGPHALVRLARLLRVVAVDQRLRVLDTAAVEVAHGQDPRLLVLPDSGQVVAARDAAGADRADGDAVARRRGAEHGRRHDRREAGGQHGAADPAAGRRERLAARDTTARA